MDAHADKSIIRNVRVRQGESVTLGSDGATPQEITCDDIARLALAMHEHSYFFSLRRGLNIRFSRDLNGSTSSTFGHPSILSRISPPGRTKGSVW